MDGDKEKLEDHIQLLEGQISVPLTNFRKFGDTLKKINQIEGNIP
jgi:hypothetical protein